MIELFESMDKRLNIKGFTPHLYSPIALAYLGDSIYDLIIRSYVISQGAQAIGKVHKEVSGYVKASAQAQMFYCVEEKLTEEEIAVFRRGRNAKSGSKPKNADLKTYKHATGFEAVLGYLYMQQKLDRIVELIQLGLQGIEEPRMKKKEGLNGEI